MIWLLKLTLVILLFAVVITVFAGYQWTVEFISEKTNKWFVTGYVLISLPTTIFLLSIIGGYLLHIIKNIQ